jgi:RNA polymerase sigma factor (sigma-70 family)
MVRGRGSGPNLKVVPAEADVRRVEPIFSRSVAPEVPFALLGERRNAPVELEDVFRTHQHAVFAYFLRVVGDRHAAEELTQETFVRACTAALRFRGDAPVVHWLFGIARRVLLESSRKGLFRRHVSVEEIEVPAALEDPDRRIDLERVFATLDRMDREVLVLVDLLGFTPTEAASLVNVEPAAFRMRLHRARRRLRERMEVPIDER